jgi:hypothetical protein
MLRDIILPPSEAPTAKDTKMPPGTPSFQEKERVQQAHLVNWNFMRSGGIEDVTICPLHSDHHRQGFP